MNTKIATFAAIAFAAVIVSSLVQFAPAIAQSTTEVATLDSTFAAPMTASQKVRCIMPLAQQKYCGA